MALHSLNDATLPTAPDSQSNASYMPSYDEGVTYQQDLSGSEYTTAGLTDDLNAAGWDPVLRYDSGSPVVFPNGQTD